MTKDEALKLALEALENHSGNYKLSKTESVLYKNAVDALRQALEQPEQEPVAYLYKYRDGWTTKLRFDGSKPLETKKLYTAPPKREWVGLTVEEVIGAWAISKGDVLRRLEPFARAIEAKLKEKNNG